MRVDFTPAGIYLPDIDLWLDGEGEGPAGWISHAHSDHAGGFYQRRIFGTPETLGLYKMRVPEAAGALEPLPEILNGARLTALPASHIVGSAQILIEYGGERLVYTGDIKLRNSICGVATHIVPCDRLIMESTFGLPIYRFIDREEACARIISCAQEALAEGIMPVFMGYSLGRGQEIAHVLCAAGIPTAVHGAIARFIPIYERAGFAFPGWQPYERNSVAGKALVITPEFRNVLEARGKAMRLVYVSGWAVLDNARARSGAEELIPYSDHADFEELLAIAEQSGAKRVDVVHGYAEPLARVLGLRGIEAHAPLPGSARGSIDTEEG